MFRRLFYKTHKNEFNDGRTKIYISYGYTDIAKIEYVKFDGHIINLFVDSDYRRQGLATKLIREAAKDVQADKLYCYENANNLFFKNAFGGKFKLTKMETRHYGYPCWVIDKKDI